MRGAHDAAVDELRARLAAAGMETEVVSRAATGSVYLKFADDRMGKIRVGDHDERERYGYRWQIRGDIRVPYVDDAKGHRRFFFPPTHLDVAVRRMIRYRDTIIRNSSPTEKGEAR